ncbi:hypothetical protein ACET3Z_001674 [Daucus carota]
MKIYLIGFKPCLGFREEKPQGINVDDRASQCLKTMDVCLENFTSNCKKADHRRPKCPTGENDLSGGYESVTELNGGNGARKSAGHTSATKRKTLGLKRPKLQVRRSSITQDSQTNSASEVNMGQHVHAASLLSSLSHWEAQHNNSDMHF